MNKHIDPNVQIIENATHDHIQPGDHVVFLHTWERGCLTVIERCGGIAHHRDINGDWRTERGARITNGEGEGVTLTIRRPIPAKEADQ